ncbi:uncharacterized protein LOC125661606 [Ostrea edulis]|uniref:uncharacterized protein LOC125661606 n=1 Tax=Ostrea edulis TaxID=37623 RepID=UPI0024AF61CF|nr:uncharacterized protein LOC125661606 [Ostrea edulis]
MVLILSVVLLGYLSGTCAGLKDLQTENEDLSLRELVLELKNTISYQNRRITILEDRARALENVNGNQSKDIAVLTQKMKEQEEKNLNLIKMKSVCEENARKFENLFGFSKTLVGGQASELYTSSILPTVTHTPDYSSLFRKERLLVSQGPSSQSSETTVAFYAYLTQKIPSPSAHFVLTFDTVITNVGNGFHHHSGIFIAPRTGTYAFTWSFRIQNDAHMSTELIVNDLAVGAIYFDAAGGVGGNKAGTVVVHVDQGDDVFVRTTSFNNLGDIISDHIGRSYFAGWMIG